MFLDELVDELRLGLSPNQEITKTATQHGHDMLRQGFTVPQVVHGYGDVCQSITELALALKAPISTDDFRMLNKCLDDAIASAVTQYEQEQDLNEVAAGESEQLAVLAWAPVRRNVVAMVTNAMTRSSLPSVNRSRKLTASPI